MLKLIRDWMMVPKLLWDIRRQLYLLNTSLVFMVIHGTPLPPAQILEWAKAHSEAGE